ncbi:hypothetical protein KAI87_13920 [Myxococcota bacterium]|nr:hypothetical protein [Myxococcota bacterium]
MSILPFILLTLASTGESLNTDEAINAETPIDTKTVVLKEEPAIPHTTAAEVLPDIEERYAHWLKYKRDRLQLRPVSEITPPNSFFMGAGVASTRHSRFGMGFSSGGATLSTQPNNWVIIQGAAHVIDDIDLALMMNDKILAQKIEESRFWPKLSWALGFGTASVIGLGSGAYLLQSDKNDERNAGASLFALGITTGLVALFAPAIGGGHILEVREAEKMVDDYNEKLRRELKLSPHDLAKFGTIEP